jgi:hypothetical protein
MGHVHLETTTIYAKVAVPNKQLVRSPLDVLEGRTEATPRVDTGVVQFRRRPAGRLKIQMRLAPHSTRQSPKAQGTLAVQTSTRPIYFTGIVVRQQRPGWNLIEVPPLERWEEPLRWLTPRQRERMETPEFYRMLEAEINRRFALLPKHIE